MSRNFDTETQGGQVSRLWSCSTLQDGVNHLGPGDGSQDEEALLLKQIQDTCGRRFVYIVRKKKYRIYTSGSPKYLYKSEL